MSITTTYYYGTIVDISEESEENIQKMKDAGFDIKYTEEGDTLFLGRELSTDILYAGNGCINTAGWLNGIINFDIEAEKQKFQEDVKRLNDLTGYSIPEDTYLDFFCLASD